MKLPSPPILLMVGSLSLAGAAGYGASVALSGSSAATPSTTVTVEVTGEQGPAGPAGPPGETGATGAEGPAGAGGPSDCPTGSVYGEVKFIQQGKGPTSILTCVKEAP